MPPKVTTERPAAKWWPTYTAAANRKTEGSYGQEHLFVEHEHAPLCGKKAVRAEVNATNRCVACRRIAAGGKVAVR